MRKLCQCFIFFKTTFLILVVGQGSTKLILVEVHLCSCWKCVDFWRNVLICLRAASLGKLSVINDCSYLNWKSCMLPNIFHALFVAICRPPEHQDHPTSMSVSYCSELDLLLGTILPRNKTQLRTQVGLGPNQVLGYCLKAHILHTSISEWAPCQIWIKINSQNKELLECKKARYSNNVLTKFVCI